MKKKKQKKLRSALKKIRRDDLVAILCFLFIVAVAIFNAAQGAAGRQAGVPDSEVPAGALTLTGTARPTPAPTATCPPQPRTMA